MDALLWIVAGVVLAVAEMFTTTLFLIMLAAGAFAAAVPAALGAPLPLQALVFAGVSAVTVFGLRPVIRRHQAGVRGGAGASFGVEAIGGAIAVVLERVDAYHGLVKIDGELWSARSYDETQTFAPGEQVRVIEVDGAIVRVWRDDVSPGQLPGAELPRSI